MIVSTANSFENLNPFIPWSFLPSLVEIGCVVFWKRNFHVFSIFFFLFSPSPALEMGCSFIWTNLEMIVINSQAVLEKVFCNDTVSNFPILLLPILYLPFPVEALYFNSFGAIVIFRQCLRKVPKSTIFTILIESLLYCSNTV